MKKNVGILTATRAEWGLLRPLAEQLRRQEDIQVVILATGTHFCQAYGNTYREIEQDGFSIDERVDMLLYPESGAAVSKTMGLTTIGFADVFARRKLDLLVVLGDRYETLAVCLAAMNQGVPLAHLHGGETTEGAVDEGIRHAITKLSYLHFTSCEAYRRRVIQLGEHPSRVFSVGALAADNIKHLPLLSREDLGRAIGFDCSVPYVVVTFHPVTLEEGSASDQLEELFAAMDSFPQLSYLITKSNADREGSLVNRMIDDYAGRRSRVLAVESLGALRYLSALRYAAFMMGNSSSGLFEGPYFKIPTVNIGDRQRGRIQVQSVLSCPPRRADICAAMGKALEPAFCASLKEMPDPWGEGDAAGKITQVIEDFLREGLIDRKKSFYDLQAE